MFIGYVVLGQTLKFLYQARDSSGAPIEADELPTFRIYGPDGLMANGICSMTEFDVANVTGLYQGSCSIVGGDGYEKGTTYTARVLAEIDAVEDVELNTFVVV